MSILEYLVDEIEGRTFKDREEFVETCDAILRDMEDEIGKTYRLVEWSDEKVWDVWGVKVGSKSE